MGEEAIKFANRASPHTPGQQNTISHISHQGKEMKKRKVFSSREKLGLDPPPFHLVGRLGLKSSLRLAKVLSCVLCSTLPISF